MKARLDYYRWLSAVHGRFWPLRRPFLWRSPSARTAYAAHHMVQGLLAALQILHHAHERNWRSYGDPDR